MSSRQNFPIPLQQKDSVNHSDRSVRLSGRPCAGRVALQGFGREHGGMRQSPIITSGQLCRTPIRQSKALGCELALELIWIWNAVSALVCKPVAANVDGAARTQRSVVLDDGTERQALIVPAAAVDGYQTVLTIDGYALVNAEGRAVYALNRQSHTQASESEPVVVTILDAEVAAR